MIDSSESLKVKKYRFAEKVGHSLGVQKTMDYLKPDTTQALCQELERRGFSVWYDNKMLGPACLGSKI